MDFIQNNLSSKLERLGARFYSQKLSTWAIRTQDLQHFVSTPDSLPIFSRTVNITLLRCLAQKIPPHLH
jgi:hypothetical protein